MQKLWSKPVSLFLSMALVLSAVSVSPGILAKAETETLASWNISSNPSEAPSEAKIYATDGAFKDSGFLSTNAAGSWGTSTQYFLAASGFDGEPGTKYWQVSLPDETKDSTRIAVSAGFRRSKTVTANWKVQSSKDGDSFSDVANGDFTISATSGGVKAVTFGSGDTALSLPDGTIAVRFTPADNGTTSSGGTCYINDIIVTGQTGGGGSTETVVFTPSSAPDSSGYVPGGTTVKLTATTDTAIYYELNPGNNEPGDGTKYRDPIQIHDTTTIRAWLDGGKDHPQTRTYKVDNAVVNTIGDARKAGEGHTVTLTGIATHPYANSSLGLYIQDATGGIELFGDSVLKDAGIQPGDTVEATGDTAVYNNNLELKVTGVKITKTPGEVPAPKDVSISAIGESTGGLLVKISGAVVSDLSEDSYKNANFTLTQNEKTLSAEMDSRRGDDYSAVAAKVSKGQTADFTGILQGYRGAYTLQLLGADGITNVKDSTPETPQAAPVTADPGSSVNAKVGDTVKLSCATADAKIYYTLDPAAADDNYLLYDANTPITLTALPATLTAYAAKDGLKNSEKSVFTYREKFTGTYHIYFGQLHSHTTLSDGVGSITQAYDHASKAKNLDFEAVTDHSNYFETASEAQAHKNTILDGSGSENWKEGHAAAKAITDEKIPNPDSADDPGSTFLGIYGYEMTWSDGSGHINTFDTPGFEDRQNPTYCNKKQSASNPAGLDAYYKTLTTVPDSISQFNHPGTTFGDFYDFADYSPTFDKLINLIEVGNGEGPIRGVGYFPSYEYYTRALDKGWHVAPTNNQDNHKGNWGDSNTARSVILAQSLTEENLYDALRNRRVYATEDNDLSIYYTVDSAVMGSEISVKKGESLSLHADLSDPTDKSIGTVEVIVNGGRVAAEKEISSSKASVDFSIPNNYSYYYLRVTEADKDIAVTAPVWTGEVDKAGIASVSADTDLPIKGEPVNITASLFNNETSPLTIDSLEYKIGDEVIRAVSGSGLNGGATLDSLGTKNDSFRYTPKSAGSTTIHVTLKGTLGGTSKTYTNALLMQVADPGAVTKVIIDGTHFNDYVTGYYSQSMGNVTKIAADDGTQIKVVADRITPETLKGTQLLVISAPAKNSGTSKAGDAYQPQTFSDDFIRMVKEYVQNGGTAVICGLSDYSDSPNDPYTSAAQVNSLLKGIGATSTISNDEVVDQDQNGGQPYRLYFQNYNTDSPYMKDVSPDQKYSFYSGCTVNAGKGATRLVDGFDTTYSINSRASDSVCESGIPVSSPTAVYDESNAVKKKGNVCALAEEPVGNGKVLIAGTVFLSDFEVKADKDNYEDLDYANKTIFGNILDSVKTDIPTTSIASVRATGETGAVYAVEGIVTAGSEAPNAFTDTVYLQDSTGGIDIYPIANGSGIKVGQKLRVVGHVDSYQGDKELKIGSGVEGYEVIDTAEKPVSPVSLSVADASDYTSRGGSLVKVTGTVSDLKKLGGVIQSFTLNSGSGKIRILINGYISPDIDLSGLVKENAAVSAVGLVYMDPDGVCLRVRDRNEITPAGGTDGGDSGHHRRSDDDSSPKKGTVISSATNSTVATSTVGGKTVATVTGRPDSAPVVSGNRADITITVPSSITSEISGATPQHPALIRIEPASADLVSQFDSSAVKTVGIRIRIPSEIVTGKNAGLSLCLPKEVLSKAKSTLKNIVLSVEDAGGKELYCWDFTGSALSASPVSPAADLDLAVSLGPAESGSAEAKIISDNAPGGIGVVLKFGENGLLPAPANVHLYVGGQQGIRPNSTVYLYYFNPQANILEPLPDGKYTVDASGTVTIRIVHCSEYILMPGAAAHSYPVQTDTTYPVGLKQGESYTFAVTASNGTVPALNVGDASVFTASVRRKNGVCYVTVKAIGKPGEVTALYSTLNGKKPVTLCYLFVKG
ncbi:hypothetical protein CAFE_19250 [Caprobacter fermentans]|uniref:GH29D-like beta-sandwich domain-containing protein n=1 Tax=Caproicibacter fermentans TaxID=2576756 RepID=A0A6N8I0G9_9FIRM|nr:CehA/McbA family metallohydrolase [Caproicibacter fermentans]MVB11217.1 hypothetical protein [Caproicibacter fermentans]